MEWWTHARTVHSYTEVEEYQPITQSHTTRREREENHSHSLLPPTFSLISLSLQTQTSEISSCANLHTRLHTNTHAHTLWAGQKNQYWSWGQLFWAHHSTVMPNVRWFMTGNAFPLPRLTERQIPLFFSPFYSSCTRSLSPSLSCSLTGSRVMRTTLHRRGLYAN